MNFIHRHVEQETRWVAKPWDMAPPAAQAAAGRMLRWRVCSAFFNVLSAAMTDCTSDIPSSVQEPRLWSDGRWTARVIKNEDDDGWAVAMVLQGEDEPALVGPWTMGRDKKNPKPLDVNAFNTLVKTASEVLRRHEQQLHAQLNKNVTITWGGERVRVLLAIVPDDEGATATLAAQDALGVELACVPVPPTFRLTVDSAMAWAGSGFERPR